MGDFKKWMKDQNSPVFEFTKNPLIGVRVESKLTSKKLVHRISPEEGNRHALSEDFCNDGGIIEEVDGKNFLIRVDSGSFYISKNNVIRA